MFTNFVKKAAFFYVDPVAGDSISVSSHQSLVQEELHKDYTHQVSRCSCISNISAKWTTCSTENNLTDEVTQYLGADIKT